MVIRAMKCVVGADLPQGRGRRKGNRESSLSITTPLCTPCTVDHTME